MLELVTLIVSLAWLPDPEDKTQLSQKRATIVRIGNASFRPGEREAVQEVIRLARIYGFGNLIAHLKRAWAVDLKKKYGGTYEYHLSAADVDAYPEHFNHLDEQPGV